MLPVIERGGFRTSLVDRKTAERTLLRAAVGFRIPEPIRLADRLAARAKRELLSKCDPE